MQLTTAHVLCGFVWMVTTAGCGLFDQRPQELMGEGIVRGTLGSHQEGAVRLVPAGTTALSGQVLALEGGAYVLREDDGAERRIALDENTRIDRPAHIGDRIQAWLDDRGRAVLIRNIDHE